MPTKQRPYRVDYFDKHEIARYSPINILSSTKILSDAVLVHSVIVRAVTAKDAELLVGVPGRFIIRAYRFYKKLSKKKVWKPYTPALAKIKECGPFANEVKPVTGDVSVPAAPLTVRGLGYGDQVERKSPTLAECPTCQSTDKDEHRCTDARCIHADLLNLKGEFVDHDFTPCTDSWHELCGKEHVTNPEALKLNDPVEAERDIKVSSSLSLLSVKSEQPLISWQGPTATTIATHYCPVCGSTKKEERGDINFVNDAGKFVNDAGKSEIESCKNPWHDNVFDWTDISKSKIEASSDQPPCNQPGFQLADEVEGVLSWTCAAIVSGAIAVIAATLIYAATR
jgi:hypothetical protein